MKTLLPLSSIAQDRLAALVGVAFDIDDTVTREGRLEPQAFDAMWRLHDAGLTLVAVTGRPLGWVDVVARHWPVHLAVGENGAGWVRVEGHRARCGYFVDDATRARHAATLTRVRARVSAELPHIPIADDGGARRCDLAWDVNENVHIDPVDVDRLTAIIGEEGCHASVSSVHAHAAPGDWDKAKGVAVAMRDALGRHLDDERERWAFIGDSGNDAAAFGYFGVSVGVANLRPVDPKPMFITRGERGDGFAELADAIVDARQR